MSKWAVVHATKDDKEWVMEQCKAFLEFSGMPVPYNRNTLEALWENENVYVIIAEEDGERKGLGVFSVAPHPFNEEVLTFQELVWWVPPIHRNGRAGLILLDAMCRLGDGCDMQVFSTLHNSPLADRALTKRGFVKQEQAYMRVL